MLPVEKAGRGRSSRQTEGATEESLALNHELPLCGEWVGLSEFEVLAIQGTVQTLILHNQNRG
jgi:hypothetical protein